MSSTADKIKKRIKSRTVLPEIGGILISGFGYANKYMGGINAMYRVYTGLRKKYSHKIGSHSFENYGKNAPSRVYVCWLQGMENAPELVKHCFSSMQYHIKDREIVIITQDNFSDYCTLPDYIIEKWNKGIIPPALFSDILRLQLLIENGGIWLDATVYLSAPLPDYITESELFVYQAGWFDNELINMGNWLIGATPNNIILNETRALLLEYWKTHNYVKQYFIFHLFFKMVTAVYKKEWEAVPYLNQLDNHLLQQEIADKFDEKRWETIKSTTPVHKLTNKLKPAEFEENSFYSRLNELYRI